MRLVERLLWVIVALALLMKLLHLPLASLLLIISASTVSMLYWALGWIIFPTPTRKDQVLGLSILAGFAFTALITGMLFRIQVWPNAGVQLAIGLVLGAATVLLVLHFRRRRPHLGSYTRSLLWRAVPLLAAGALLYPVSAAQMVRFHYRGASEARIDLFQRLYTTPDEAGHQRILQSLDSLDRVEAAARDSMP